jgi:serine/threonine-protein kinase
MLHRRAVIKLLHPEYSKNLEIVTLFFNETRATTSINNSGSRPAVQVFDFGNHVDGRAYIVMEMFDGEPLDQRLARQGALQLSEALRTRGYHPPRSLIVYVETVTPRTV